MTARLHPGDGYRVEFPARVIQMAQDHLVLDQTYFFGPHELVASDVGSIQGLVVNDIRRSVDNVIEHVLAEPIDRRGQSPLSIGCLVDCTIDWGHRYDVMRLHTAQHMVELGARATHDVVKVELRSVTNSAAELAIEFNDANIDCPAILDWLDTVIDDDLSCEVTTAGSPPFDQVWHLDGHGHSRCSALHVNSTSEIDCVTLCSSLLEPDRLLVTLHAESNHHMAEPNGSGVFTSITERGRYRLGNDRRSSR